MDEKTYLERIDELNRKLSEENTEEILSEVATLEKIKPVRAPLFALKAKAMFYKDKNNCNVSSHLSGKSNASYDYPGVKEILRVYKEQAVWHKDELDIRRNERLENNLEKEKKRPEKIQLLYQKIIKEDISKETLTELQNESYVCQEWVMYHVVSLVLEQNYQMENTSREWTKQICNIGYLREYLLNKKNNKIYFTGITEKEHAKFEVLKTCLQMLGKKIIETDTVDEATEHMDGFALFFSTVKFYQKSVFHRHSGYLYGGYEKYEDETVFGWLGNGLDYLSDLYGEDCNLLIDRKPTKKFSIIIPARNSVNTLRYTLQTCLEQRYTGTYEIIISDNSTGHNADIYEMCTDWNDSRIKYMKTPRDLPLPKSFEYAYLHSSGEYVFAIGSDDGLLPWTLSALEEVTEACPDEEIIQWERGFYAWSDFNGGQQNQFTIPRKYEKDVLEVKYKDNIGYLAEILNNPREMYSLPMLYINSCFKRSYMKRLADRTGRLWDGVCQDIYMGVLTACIHEKILNVKYPLTIAGMSSGSVGAKSNIGEKTNREFEAMMAERTHDNNAGGYCLTDMEKLISFTGTDTSSLYITLLRLVQMNIIPESYLSEVFDWKKMFQNLAKELDIRDVTFDRKLHEMYYAAAWHGKDFQTWFQNDILIPMLRPVIIDEARLQKIEKEKTYTNAQNPEGGITVDASEYGVKNIYDAVRLFEKLTEL